MLTFRLGAEEAERMTGETIPLDLMPASRGRIGITRRFPIGPVAAISPFNFPLNLAAHKLSPAIAAGCSIVLKPPSKDPLTMLTVGEIVAEAGLPAGAVSILPMTRELGDRMVEDERFKLLTFTGSPSVGWRMKARAGKKKVVLELGGNAGVIVDRTADLDWAVRRILVGAFAYAGQVCISVQRMFVHEDVWDAFMAKFVEGAKGLKVGDPADPQTDLGPMVDEAAAARTQRWVDEAVALGGKVLARRHGRRHVLPADDPDRRAGHAPRSARTRRSRRSSSPSRSATSTTRSTGSTTRCSASRPASSRTTWPTAGGRSTGSRSAGSSSTTSRPTGSTTCRTAGSRTPASGREGLRWAIEDMTEIRIMVVAQPQ